MKKDVVMYFHGGSKNHGCEAIVRSTAQIFKERMDTYSMYPDEDMEYNLDEVVNIIYDSENVISKPSWKYYLSAAQIKLLNRTNLITYFRWEHFFKQIKKGSIYLSTGGDNYCYTDLDKLSDYNYLIKSKGGKTVLWGCSIEPEKIKGKTIDDLKRYDLIVARETLTVDALKQAGIVNNVVCYPDPAFVLPVIRSQLPKGFEENNMVGINASPLILSCESKAGITFQNYLNLVKFIRNNTDMGVVLIPHVVKSESNDLEVLHMIKDYFQDDNKVILMEDDNCERLKGYISKCRIFVGARTHATIAAYSTGIPTLVIGYSIKSRGIAKDIFGTSENYVKPVQDLKNPNDLIKSFQWILNRENKIKTHLSTFMPNYKNRISEIRDIVMSL